MLVGWVGRTSTAPECRAPPWTVERASLVNKTEGLLKFLTVWQQAPVTRDEPDRVVVEAESTPDATQVAFTFNRGDG